LENDIFNLLQYKVFLYKSFFFKLYFPFIYSKLIEKISDEEIYEFNKNILKYDNEQITKLIYPLTFLKQIPIEILSLNFGLEYTL
jgi:hypothetical protein